MATTTQPWPPRPNHGRDRFGVLQVEPPKGYFGDDTGLNAVRLFCSEGGTATSSEGPRGAWTRRVTCPPGQYIMSFRLRVEAPRGLWDDTAANNMAAICSGGSLLEGSGGPLGTWGNWSVPCPPRAGVCGLRTRLEPPVKRAGNSPGLNDVELYCCS
ncbi:PREDICTED: vitelline membrane outer layer protein 1 homolog [Acanthisitta chloris]|uniref:vitelline membrane outer layer protein 1 homolog n=1 Tax=Acanthisitta chloris TaxID=57068 RepID=UPI0004F0C465|nr:PREDICTED: vitelline membrane outer layer protein 1 homolog [Acanthisitta chloris]